MEEKTVHKYAYVDTKSINGNKITGAIASTSNMDRDGDIVDPLGVDLDNFKRNSVLLWAHDYSQLPIGKVTDIGVTDEGIKFDAELAVEENSMSKTVMSLFKGGFLNAFSIGFIIKERLNEVIQRAELLEISAVPVPANADALLTREFKSLYKYMNVAETKQKNLEQKKEVSDPVDIKMSFDAEQINELTKSIEQEFVNVEQGLIKELNITNDQIDDLHKTMKKYLAIQEQEMKMKRKQKRQRNIINKAFSNIIT